MMSQWSFWLKLFAGALAIGIFFSARSFLDLGGGGSSGGSGGGTASAGAMAIYLPHRQHDDISGGGGGGRPGGNRMSEPRGGLAIAVCTRLKNEAIYLTEWLEFHLIAGVGHFYIFDDGSTDATLDVLAPYERRGIVTVQRGVDHSHDADHGRFGHRDQCIAENRANATWIAMIDADEFLFPSEGLDLRAHLASKCSSNLAFLMLRWHIFGSNGIAHRPNGLVVRLGVLACFVKPFGYVFPSNVLARVTAPLRLRRWTTTACTSAWMRLPPRARPSLWDASTSSRPSAPSSS